MIFTFEEAKFLRFCCQCFLEDEQLIPTLRYEELRKPMPSYLDEDDAVTLFVQATNKTFCGLVSAKPLTPAEVLALWYALSYTVNTYELSAVAEQVALPVAQKLGDLYEEIWPSLPPDLSALTGHDYS